MSATLESVKDKLRMVVSHFKCKSVYFSLEEIEILVAECERMTKRINELEQVIEDVAVGTAIQCCSCHKYKPCMCDK